jgi:hypothetical protein
LRKQTVNQSPSQTVLWTGIFHGHKKKSASPTQAEARTNGTKDLSESTVQDEPMVDAEVPIEDQELEAVLESNDPPSLVLE